MTDQDFYNEIGSVLAASGPKDAREIILKARIFNEEDGSELSFDYVNSAGDVSWFDPDARAIVELTDLLVGLRRFYKENKMAGENEVWTKCEIKLFLDKMRFSVDFKYEE